MWIRRKHVEEIRDWMVHISGIVNRLELSLIYDENGNFPNKIERLEKEIEHVHNCLSGELSLLPKMVAEELEKKSPKARKNPR